MCVFFISPTTFVPNVSHSKNWETEREREREREMVKNFYRSSCKVPLFLAYCKGIRIFSTDFWKILQNQISWKSPPPFGARSFHADGRMDMLDEANSCFFAILRKSLKTTMHQISGRITGTPVCLHCLYASTSPCLHCLYASTPPCLHCLYAGTPLSALPVC